MSTRSSPERWLLRNFFQQVPIELEEAAQVDGATRLTALRRVVVLFAQRRIVTGLTAGSFR